MTEFKQNKADRYLETSHRELKSVFTKIRELEELNRCFSAHLDPTIRNYCRVATVMTNRLIILCANGSIATQLRYLTVDLVKKFKEDPMLRNITDIHCKVRLPHEQENGRAPAKRFPKMLPMSEETAEIVRDMAQSIEDSKLREIMERIASRTKR